MVVSADASQTAPVAAAAVVVVVVVVVVMGAWRKEAGLRYRGETPAIEPPVSASALPWHEPLPWRQPSQRPRPQQPLTDLTPVTSGRPRQAPACTAPRQREGQQMWHLGEFPLRGDLLRDWAIRCSAGIDWHWAGPTAHCQGRGDWWCRRRCSSEGDSSGSCNDQGLPPSRRDGQRRRGQW